ncbi:transposase [Thermoanaerobacterium sp. RBIITD]|uniref:IS110 family transposase n=1 Tax=Thermoanaerobacterium sp. RBIITD TaxID=1550240 RepID=UPI000BB741E0|nr:transposase [Thermoanaerobacterium sp. RBIITD]
MKLFIGVDVSSDDLKTCIMDSEGNTLKKFAVQTILLVQVFQDQVIFYADKHSCQEIRIGMESTSVYSFHPAMFLNEDETLSKRQTKVYIINATLVNKFKESYPYLDKTDDVDAWVIADRLRFGRIPTCCSNAGTAPCLSKVD